ISGARGANSVTMPGATVDLHGSFTPSATFAGGAYIVSVNNTFIFNGTSSQTIPTASGLTYNNIQISGSGTKTLNANVPLVGNLIVNGAGVGLDLATFTINRTALGGTLTLGVGNTLRIGGTNGFPANYLTNTLSATSTVEYYGSNQAVAALGYGNLTISGSGTKTLQGSITPAGNLAVLGGTFDLQSLTANRASAGGTLSVSDGATLKIGGTNT